MPDAFHDDSRDMGASVLGTTSDTWLHYLLDEATTMAVAISSMRCHAIPNDGSNDILHAMPGHTEQVLLRRLKSDDILHAMPGRTERWQ